MSRSCSIETLEARQLFAVSAVQDGGLLTITRAHNVQVTERDDGVIAVTDRRTRTTTTVFTGVTDVVLTGTRSEDVLSVGVFSVNVTVVADNDNPRFTDDILVANNGTGSVEVFASQADKVVTSGDVVVHRQNA